MIRTLASGLKGALRLELTLPSSTPGEYILKVHTLKCVNMHHGVCGDEATAQNLLTLCQQLARQLDIPVSTTLERPKIISTVVKRLGKAKGGAS